MKESAAKPLAPPRLLLGIALLFWGALVGKPLVGLVCALAVEARWWTDLRWSFRERGFVRAWSLCITLLALFTMWSWFVSDRGIHLFDVLMWMPVYLLPMILAQQYGTASTMPLNTFSFIARRRMHLDRSAGRPVRPVRVNFGYAYFCAVMLSAAVARPSGSREGMEDRWWFFVGLLTVATLALFFVSPRPRRRPVAWVCALAMVAVANTVVTFGLLQLYALLQEQSFGRNYSVPLASESRTAIGEVGEIKLSREIFWRGSGEVPPLLRETAFNRYGLGRWVHIPPEGRLRGDDFVEAVLGNSDETGKQFAFRREDLGIDKNRIARMNLRGASKQLLPLPLPAEARLLERVRTDGIFFTSLGTVLADNPDLGVLDFAVYYQRPGNRGPGPVGEGREATGFEWPPTRQDLEVPGDEKEAMARVCAALGLDAMDQPEKLKKLRNHFLREFRYTLYNDDGTGRGSGRAPGKPRVDVGPMAERAVGRFLEQTRSGHCEYFATAAALLLRETGIPARYCVGFSARQEFNERRAEWVMRGSHAHAWCRVYLGGREEETLLPDGTTGMAWTGGRWIDFDPTPPSWVTVEGIGSSWEQRVLDWIQLVREDFLLWRTRQGNVSKVSWGVALVGTLLVLYVAVRLWQGRTRTGKVRKRRRRAAPAGAARTPLLALAKPAEKWLGPRPEGIAMTRWLMRLADPLPELRPDLHRAVNLHWKARFDPLGLEAAEQDRLRETCRDLGKALRRSKRPR